MQTGISYFGNRILKHAARDIQDIAKNNCSYIVHTFSENDLQYYKGTIEKIVQLTHKAGLRAHLDPWGVGGMFGGESYTNYASRNLEVRQIISNGDSVPVVCLNNEKVREFIKEWVDAAVEIGADAIFWDEPHFFLPSWLNYTDMNLWGCRCNVCLELFKREFGYEMPVLLEENIIKFKQKSLVTFLKEMCDYVRKKGVLNSVCLLASVVQMESGFWDNVARIESLDSIGTDPYWVDTEKEEANFDLEVFFRPFCSKIRQLSGTHDKTGHIWIQNFEIPAGGEKNIERAVDIAYEEGIRDIAAWSYYGTSCMSSRASQNPELVWRTLGKCYKKLRGFSRKKSK